MIKLKTLIEDVVVEEESEAATQAKQLGLTSAGWGTWKDNSGATVAKTVQGKLVKIDPMQGDGNTEPSDGTDISPSDSGVRSYQVWFHRMCKVRNLTVRLSHLQRSHSR